MSAGVSEAGTRTAGEPAGAPSSGEHLLHVWRQADDDPTDLAQEAGLIIGCSCSWTRWFPDGTALQVLTDTAATGHTHE